MLGMISRPESDYIEMNIQKWKHTIYFILFIFFSAYYKDNICCFPHITNYLSVCMYIEKTCLSKDTKRVT